MSNPIIPHDEPAPDVAQPIAANPPRRIFRYREMKSMPRGIEMKEFVYSGGEINFVGQYFNTKNTQPNSRPKRVYEIIVRRDLIKPWAWQAIVREDFQELVTLRGEKKWDVCYAALGALRGILHKRCVSVRSNRKARKAAKLAAEKEVA